MDECKPLHMGLLWNPAPALDPAAVTPDPALPKVGQCRLTLSNPC